MSYTPKTWHTGDTVSASDLNHLEQGVADAGGGGMLVITDTEGVLNKTWQQIYDAMAASTFCIVVETHDDGVIISVTINYIQSIVEQEGVYSLTFGDGTFYEASSANDYPVIVD